MVTGKLEQLGLAGALGRLFPDHEFNCLTYRPPNEHYVSFTSSKLPIPPLTGGIRTTIDVLVADAASIATGPHAPDLVVILDDLELANAHQPGVVVECFLEGVNNHLGDKLDERQRQQTRTALRNKVSLHFAAPMIESWLFADPGGLGRVNKAPSAIPTCLSCGRNFEDFSTDDAAYLVDDCSGCQAWTKVLAHPSRLTTSKRRANHPEWCKGDADTDARSRHPKRYLAWLCRDLQAKKCSTYKESEAATALRELNWSALTKRANMPFLYSLIDDLANGLGEDCPLRADPVLEPLTCLKRGSEAVLRNM